VAPDTPLRHGLLLMTQDPPDAERIGALWQEMLDLAPVAEASGFHSIHVPEHHARDDGYLSQPLVACAALAARTRSIKVGTALTVAPLRHPLHCAEEAAVVDVISGGRLVLAIGIGNYRPEYEMFGVPFTELGERLDEYLDFLLRALTGERVSIEGKHYQIPDTVVRPRPIQSPRPDVWLGAMSAAGCARAGRLGLPLLLDPLQTIEELEALVDVYRDEASSSGHDPRVILMRWGWVSAAGEPGQAEDVWWPHVRPALWSYLVDIPRIDRSSSPALAGVTTPDDLRLDDVADDRLLVGDGPRVTELLRDWSTRLGAEQVLVKLQGSTGPWGDELRQAVHRYGAEVIASTRDEELG
jgi:alkanesulfonate monooxygenase SsuD/methylene tetrahydromethanopterin reductase-like flavin-dependent oxidoreductase (luciferase family)